MINMENSYLQKTSSGGIMLLEVGFSHAYFFVQFYAFNSRQLPTGKAVNPQVKDVVLLTY